MASALVNAEVRRAEDRAAYQTAWDAYEAEPSDANLVTLEENRSRLALTIAIQEG